MADFQRLTSVGDDLAGDFSGALPQLSGKCQHRLAAVWQSIRACELAEDNCSTEAWSKDCNFLRFVRQAKWTAWIKLVLGLAWIALGIVFLVLTADDTNDQEYRSSLSTSLYVKPGGVRTYVPQFESVGTWVPGYVLMTPPLFIGAWHVIAWLLDTFGFWGGLTGLHIHNVKVHVWAPRLLAAAVGFGLTSLVLAAAAGVTDVLVLTTVTANAFLAVYALYIYEDSGKRYPYFSVLMNPDGTIISHHGRIQRPGEKAAVRRSSASWSALLAALALAAWSAIVIGIYWDRLGGTDTPDFILTAYIGLLAGWGFMFIIEIIRGLGWFDEGIAFELTWVFGVNGLLAFALIVLFIGNSDKEIINVFNNIVRA